MCVRMMIFSKALIPVVFSVNKQCRKRARGEKYFNPYIRSILKQYSCSRFQVAHRENPVKVPLCLAYGNLDRISTASCMVYKGCRHPSTTELSE